MAVMGPSGCAKLPFGGIASLDLLCPTDNRFNSEQFSDDPINAPLFSSRTAKCMFPMGLLFGIINTIPVATLDYSLACDCALEEDERGFDGTELCQGRGWLCAISRHGIFVTMCVFYLVAAMNLKLLIKIKYMHIPTYVEKAADGLPFILPGMCVIAALALDFSPQDEPSKPFATLIVVRDAFSCNPRFPNFATEFVFKQMHFVFGSGIIAIAILLLLQHILHVAGKSSDLHASGSSVSRNMGSFQTAHGHFKDITKKVTDIRYHLRHTKSERLVVLGLVCMILFIVNLTITILTLPVLETVKDAADQRQDCISQYRLGCGADKTCETQGSCSSHDGCEAAEYCSQQGRCKSCYKCPYDGDGIGGECRAEACPLNSMMNDKQLCTFNYCAVELAAVK